jgi:glutathione synthase
MARGWPIELRREVGNHVSYGPETEVDLGEFDVVWLRQDPPFDMGYITTTHLLEMIHPKTLVVNDPFWVRNSPEKLLVLRFPDLTPPTTIARDLATIRAFKARHGDIILKPLYGNGGAGVFRLDPNDRNLRRCTSCSPGISREPLIVQKFLPDVAKGDKRVILVDGEPVGAINRVPQAGETRSNMHAGGRPEKVGLTERAIWRSARGSGRCCGKGAGLRRDRRDRRLADRDQRDLAHRHAGAGAV